MGDKVDPKKRELLLKSSLGFKDRMDLIVTKGFGISFEKPEYENNFLADFLNKT
jgi:hypothetical protein